MNMRPIRIRRTYEHEARQAIAELEKRGYEVISPLKMVTKGRKDFERENNHFKFAGFIESTFWTATLRKVE